MIKLYTDLQTFPALFIPPIVGSHNKFAYVPSVQECDYIVLPHWEVLWEYSDAQYQKRNLSPMLRQSIQQSVNELIALAKANHKSLLVVHWSDSDKDIPLDNAVILRTSLYKSSQKPNVFAYPSWGGDFRNDIPRDDSTFRNKQEKPRVGFRGSAIPFGFSIENLIRSKINFANAVLAQVTSNYRLPYAWNQGQQLRKKAMKKLRNNPTIYTDFTVLTRGYISQKNKDQKETNRQLFVKNLLDNDYILCVRGAGNYSFRFYETLCAGRIPLFINTDCVLPFDFMVDWKKYCVWVEEADISRIDQILLDFHNSLSNDDFMDLQLNIRKLWEDWISPEGFPKNVDKYLQHYESTRIVNSMPL